MGQIIRVQCEHCGFTKEIFAGGGRKDCELATILAALPEDRRHILASAVGSGAVWISITRKPCACGACKSLYSRPVVEYTLYGIKRKLHGVCPQCGAENAGWKDEEELRCPACGAGLLQQQIGHWD